MVGLAKRISHVAFGYEADLSSSYKRLQRSKMGAFDVISGNGYGKAYCHSRAVLANLNLVLRHCCSQRSMPAHFSAITMYALLAVACLSKA